MPLIGRTRSGKIRARRLVKRVIAVMLGLGLGLVIAELALRLSGVVSASGVHTVTEAEYRRVPGLWGPGQRVVSREKPELPYEVTINELGYRGEDFPREKPAGEYRILMLGDSGTFGDFVDDAQTLPAALEAQLVAMCPGPVRVINAGVGGTTVVTALHMAERALGLSPDLAVLVFSENDIQNMAGVPQWEVLARNRALKSRFPLGWVYPTVRSMALWHLALRVRGNLRARREVERANPSSTGAGPSSGIEPLRARYRITLTALRDTLVSRGVPLVFAVYPSHRTVEGTESEEQVRWAASMADSLSLPTIDLLTPLRATGLAMEVLYLLPRDGHASPLGYRHAASAMTSALVDLTPVCGSR